MCMCMCVLCIDKSWSLSYVLCIWIHSGISSCAYVSLMLLLRLLIAFTLIISIFLPFPSLSRVFPPFFISHLVNCKCPFHTWFASPSSRWPHNQFSYFFFFFLMRHCWYHIINVSSTKIPCIIFNRFLYSYSMKLFLRFYSFLEWKISK